METQLPLEPPNAAPAREVYTVSQLNREVRDLLDASFPPVWVEGELSNLATPASGHMYFTLKDDRSQVRCAMFRSRNRLLSFAPENGLQVLVRARVGLYEGRGEYQLVVDQMEPAGDGRLRLAFEQLKQRLAAEGLFDPQLKRPLPAISRCVGVITSPTGAAIRDILSVLRRRFPALPVIIYPSAVQGGGAPAELLAALDRANRRRECDVLILARGGGSLEDLWAFNDEALARGIRASDIPVVVGVGHDIDFTIADFVADVRAPTPSAAAELVSLDQAELRRQMQRCAVQLTRRFFDRLERARERLTWLQRRLVHPGKRLQDLAQKLDELSLRLRSALVQRLRGERARLTEARSRLYGFNPLHGLRAAEARRQNLRLRMINALRSRIGRHGTALARLAGTLDAVSPLRTLNRGYAIVRRWPDGALIRDAAQVSRGQRIRAQVARGEIDAEVVATRGDEEPQSS